MGVASEATAAEGRWSAAGGELSSTRAAGLAARVDLSPPPTAPQRTPCSRAPSRHTTNYSKGFQNPPPIEFMQPLRSR
eukprot:9295420-Alexandrium_andersonii.AAC.1